MTAFEASPIHATTMTERTETWPAPLAFSGEARRRAHAGACRMAVVMTSFNRRQKTMDCLKALSGSRDVGQVELSGVLVDDGSSDGTAEAVRQAYPWVKIEHGDGSLFWCRGMHRAFGIAMERGFDYYLWLNDDTMLYPDTLARLFACEAERREHTGRPAIVVGSTVDEETGKRTYGGERRAAWWRRTSFVGLQPRDEAQACESMNGNIVLIPAESAARVGNLDPAFEHAMGDTDYALRANRLGVGVWAAPGVHGTCGHNALGDTFLDSGLPLSGRWKRMLGRKGLPWRSWWVLTRRHAGPFWPVYFIWPYVRTVLSAARPHSK